MDRVITERELRRCDGERGRPAYVAYQGRVYDVSDCPRWRSLPHERMHFAGLDLTEDLEAAPHAAEVFTRPCVKLVGVLELPGVDGEAVS